MNPKVSIITPCFNCEEYIERYINRILVQDYDNIQLVFVNDGSTDSTESILLNNKNRIIDRGFEFTYVFQENKGLGGAINTGLKKISGDYFTWCDSDNFYTNDYVSQKVAFFLNHPEYSVVRCDGTIVDENDLNTPLGLMSKGNTDLYNEHLFENCLLVHNFHFGCAMVKTEDFDKVNPNREIYPSRAGQNWQLLLPMFYHYRSGYIDKPMFYFVIRKDSISNITQYQDLSHRINKLYEYEKIITETLNSMGIPDKDVYLEKVRIKYAVQRFYQFAYSHDSVNAGKEYEFLKSNNHGGLRLWFVLMRSKSRLFDKMIRLIK